MTSEKAYRLEEGPRGKFAVAVRNIQAGEMVSEEKEPLLFFRNSVDDKKAMEYISFESGVTSHGMDKLSPAFSNFMREVSPEKQSKLLTLFGPTTGTSAETMREIAGWIRFRWKTDEKHRRLTPDEVETFVKVSEVIGMNGQGARDIGYGIYEEVSYFGHSCDSNIVCTLQDKAARCYTKRSIQAGEQMTIPCISHRDLEPIHERRYKYLETKQFTCHCPRCDAYGDDMRQFDCVDSSCPGVMIARQPLNKWKFRIPGLFYTGVEYVEPHLLPCTLCHRAAPTDYQEKMFRKESCLPGVAESVKNQFETFSGMGGPPELLYMLATVLAHKIARHHAAVLPLLKLEFRIRYLLCQCHFGTAREVQAALRAYIAAFEYLFPRGHNELQRDLVFVAVLCCDGINPSVMPIQDEKLLIQRALRNHLLVKGRSNRYEELDNATARVLKQLPPVESTELCSFCDESPQHAAMKRSRCGQCKQVVYCSAGCQKAHWPLHKKTSKEKT